MATFDSVETIGSELTADESQEKQLEKLQEEIAKKDLQIDDLIHKVEHLQEVEAEVREELMIEATRADEAERKLTILREAFAILGFGSEERND